MPRHSYDIIVSARIELGGKFDADSAEEAIAAAKGELRTAGDISDLEVERCMFLDDETGDAKLAEALPNPE